MAVDTTLAKIETEMARGELGRARDRLHGLLVTYPADLTVRERLGEVYWRLQYPELAGRYWYLAPTRSEEMKRAKEAFERRYGNSASLMLYELRYRGGLDAVRGTYAEEVLRFTAKRAHMSEARLQRLVRPREPGERSRTADPGAAWQWWLLIAL